MLPKKINLKKLKIALSINLKLQKQNTLLANKKSFFLLEFFNNSGILVESSQTNLKTLNTLANTRFGSFLLLKMDQIVLYWRAFFIFFFFILQKNKEISQKILKHMRTLFFVKDYGPLVNYYMSKDERVKKFKSLLEKFQILQNIPFFIFINFPKTVNFFSLKHILDKSQYNVVVVEAKSNYTISQRLQDFFSLANSKKHILYFLYKPSTISNDLLKSFIKFKRKIGKTESEQISFNYNPVEKHLVISISEFSKVEDYTVVGNLKSQYSLDFFYYLLGVFIKNIKNKKQRLSNFRRINNLVGKESLIETKIKTKIKKKKYLTLVKTRNNNYKKIYKNLLKKKNLIMI